jgi:hypothetical protein
MVGTDNKIINPNIVTTTLCITIFNFIHVSKSKYCSRLKFSTYLLATRDFIVVRINDMYPTRVTGKVSSVQTFTVSLLAATHNVWQICDLPEPNSPASSVMAWVSKPPFSKPSKFSEPVAYLDILFRFSNTSSAVENSFVKTPFSIRVFLAVAMSVEADSTLTDVSSYSVASSTGFCTAN